MRLVPITAEDEDLAVRLECDPALMLHIHAYSTVHNGASNAIVNGGIGMQNQVEFDNEGFAGVLRCNNWRIDLRQMPAEKAVTRSSFFTTFLPQPWSDCQGFFVWEICDKWYNVARRTQ